MLRNFKMYHSYVSFFWGLQSAKVYCARWWMASYGSKIPKRHVMYSNSKDISGFDLGKLCFDYSDPEYQKNRTTKVVVKQLEGGQTKKAFQGVKHKLKASQYLDWIIPKDPMNLFSNWGMGFWNLYRFNITESEVFQQIEKAMNHITTGIILYCL